MYKTVNPVTSSALLTLQTAARRAQAAYQWEEASAHYTEALHLPDLSSVDGYALRDGRAFSSQRLGQFQLELADLEKMVVLSSDEPTDYLTKPLDADLLSEKLHIYLEMD